MNELTNNPARRLAESTLGYLQLVSDEDFEALVDAYLRTGNMFLYHTANAIIAGENNLNAMSKMQSAQSDLLPKDEQVQLPAQGGR